MLLSRRATLIDICRSLFFLLYRFRRLLYNTHDENTNDTKCGYHGDGGVDEVMDMDMDMDMR